MKTLLSGIVVETERNDWSFNGRSGVAYAVMVRTEGSRASESATRVKVSAEQYGQYGEGDHVDLPVDIFANTVERSGVITGAKLSVQLSPEYVYVRSAHGLKAADKAS